MTQVVLSKVTVSRPPEEINVDVASTNLRYQTSGNGPPLLWLHGIWGESGWRPHLQVLSEHFQVYRIDLPGYPGSEKPSWIKSVRELAYFMIDVLDALGLERTLVGGHCLGGWLGAELALLRPQRVSKLALISPLGVLRDWTKSPNLFYSDPVELPSYFFKDYERTYEEAKHFVPKDLGDWDEDFLTSREGSAYYAFDPYLHDSTFAHRLHHLTIPTLAIWGSEDKIVASEHCEDWNGRIGNSKSAVVQGTGHIPFVEEPDQVLNIIVDFLLDGPRPPDAD